MIPILSRFSPTFPIIFHQLLRRILDELNKRMANAKKINMRVVQLPLDIILDILSRLPVKSLLRFKSVCKDWYNIISDPSFVETQVQRAKSNIGFIVETPIPISKYHMVIRGIDSNSYFVETQIWRSNSQFGYLNESPISNKIVWDPFFFDVKASPKNNKFYYIDMARSVGDLTRISAACDGLILLESLSKYGIVYICNPAMHRWICLGRYIDPPDGCHSLGLAFDPSIRKYKVVRMVSRQRDLDVCEIINVDKNFNSWREVMVPKPHRPRSSPPVYANSCLHWMIHHPNIPDLKGHLSSDPQSMGCILTMDVVKETFRTISHPECRSGFYSLLQMGGLLCFANTVSHTHLDLWVLKNVEKPIWNKNYSVDVENFIGRSVPIKSLLDDVFPLAILEDPWRIIFKRPKKWRRLFSYDLQRRVLSKLSLECKFIAPENKDDLGDVERWCPHVHVNSLANWENVCML